MGGYTWSQLCDSEDWKVRVTKKLNAPLARELLETKYYLRFSSRHCDDIRKTIMKELRKVRQKHDQYVEIITELSSAAGILNSFQPRLKSIEMKNNAAERRELKFIRKFREGLALHMEEIEKTLHLKALGYGELLNTRAVADPIGFKAELVEARKKAKQMEALFDRLQMEWDKEKKSIKRDMDYCTRHIREVLENFFEVEQ
ncbi:unnamed protein product [Orchesella dallaii]